MGDAELLITIAHILTTEADLTEALRRVVREVVRFVGAETGAAYRVDREQRVLAPVAAYRVPKHTLPVLTSAVLPIDEPWFRESAFAGGSVTASDDVQTDARFAFELFHRFPHRSGVVVPFHVDGDVAGALYLVWWKRAERLDLTRVSLLEAVGQQLALLLRAAWRRAEAERQRAEAERHRGEALAAEARYHGLVEHIPVGIFRTTPSGEMFDANPALLEMLKYKDREALLAVSANALWVNPDDRERGRRLLDAEGVARDFQVELRTNEGGTVWVRMNVRAIVDNVGECWEGTIEDITDQRRADEAEGRAETLRAVAQLANAAAHEINNPLAVIVGRLELLRRDLTPELQAKLNPIVESSRQIAKIITHLGRMTRLQTLDDMPASPMLDLRRSSEPTSK
ncbi:MAG TPA: GAF domain-containing protein [Methylomirabilota bacterium]|nr:GAF domain-containing protein [Methylomirabilota bacterium]